MKSVADELVKEGRARVMGLSAEERIELALELGRRDLEAFRFSFDPPLARKEARLRLQQRNQAGRVPSRCISELLQMADGGE